jgi:2-oxoisovalerate dehydrogenase E1 component
VKYTNSAKCPLPSEDYRVPLGKGRMVIEANENNVGDSKVLIISYGMGIHWSLQAAKKFEGKIGILDLRSLYPLDETLIIEKVKEYNKILLVTEEPSDNSFTMSLAGRIQEKCFEWLDAPILTIGSANVPAVPLNEVLENTVLPNPDKIALKIERLINF